MRYIHEFEPVYDKDSKILILGSFPSVKSRQYNFYYAHPQNRFWKVIYYCLSKDCEKIDYNKLEIEEKKEFLIRNNIALWDSIQSCEILGSSDASIRNVKANDISKIVLQSNIKRIIFNGKTAYDMLNKNYDMSLLKGIEIKVLPSTSPANAKFSFNDLVDVWKIYLKI